MKIIYVDVYFLINFCVDLISLYFSSQFTKIIISPVKMIVTAALGSICAVVFVFLESNPIIFSFLSIAFIIIGCLICTVGYFWTRKLKFIISFLLFEMLIGGMVYYFYNFLDQKFGNKITEADEINRKVLIFALIILVVVGLLKIALMMFSNNLSEKNAKIKIILFGKEYLTDALIDTGNLAKDPMDMSPILVIKPRLHNKIFPYGIPDITEIDRISERLKEKIRLIPMNISGANRILCGIKADGVYVLKKDKFHKINVTLVFDIEGGSFGGFDVLMPASALDCI